MFFGYARGRVPRYCFAACTWCSASIFEYTEIPDDALSITVYRFRFQRNLAAGYHCQQDPVSHQIYEVLGSSYHGSIEKFGVVPPWNTAAFMCAYLRLLHERRQSYSLEKPLTLLFDCAACHLHSTVRSLAKTLGLQVLVVPVHFNRSMHIFFGGSGRRQRAKLLKALFPEKHGYVWWPLQWGHCLRIEIGSGLLKELEWPSSRIAYRRIIEPCNGMSVLRFQLRGRPVSSQAPVLEVATLKHGWKSALVMTA